MPTAAQLLLTGGLALGFGNLWVWARGRRRPALAVFHVLLAVGGTAALGLQFLRAGASGDVTPQQIAILSLSLLAAAIVCGGAAWLARKSEYSAMALVIHAVAGFFGVLMALSLGGAL